MEFPVTVRKGDDVREATNPSSLVAFKFEGYVQESGEQIPTPTQFDPAEHSASEVNAYLLTADTDEYNRVAQLEREGKNRSTAFPA